MRTTAYIFICSFLFFTLQTFAQSNGQSGEGNVLNPELVDGQGYIISGVDETSLAMASRNSAETEWLCRAYLGDESYANPYGGRLLRHVER
jgi:hypothetical protein